MNFRRLGAWLLTGGMAVAVGPVAMAQVTFYTNPAAFQAAAGNPSSFGFNSATVGGYTTSAGITVNTFNFVASVEETGVGLIYYVGISAPNTYGNDYNRISGTSLQGPAINNPLSGPGFSQGQLTINMPAGGVTAFGIQLWDIEWGDSSGAGTDTVNMAVNGQTGSVVTPPYTGLGFIGFTSSTPVMSVRITGTKTGEYPQLAEVYYSTAPNVPVYSNTATGTLGGAPASFTSTVNGSSNGSGGTSGPYQYGYTVNYTGTGDFLVIPLYQSSDAYNLNLPSGGAQGSVAQFLTDEPPGSTIQSIFGSAFTGAIVIDLPSAPAGGSYTFSFDSAYGPKKANWLVWDSTGSDFVGIDPAIPNSQPAAPAVALQFYPLTPCRLVDTRAGEGKTGSFGPPSLAASSTRAFAILSAGCSIPVTAQAYSLNFTAVPAGPLGFLSVWPMGEPYPGVSTLNSTDGSIIANAAIVPAGTSGSINVVAGNPTDLIIDVNGYFAPATSQGLDFFPLTPCRVADTRVGEGKTGAFGPPGLAASVTRDFPIDISPCLSRSALAYSLNMTVVPDGPLGFLSTWPVGLTYPGVSTLNSSDGIALANGALVPAGTNGDIDVVAGNPTDLIIDINGMFAAAATGGLQFYPVTPCRVADTRAGENFTGAFGPPSLVASLTRDFPIQSSSCGIPATAQAYALNMTAVPQGPLGFLATWPTGQPYPGVSTLNSSEGNIVANAAIVPAGTGGAITVVAGNPTDLIIDIVGYFAP